MRKVATASDQDRRDLFEATAAKVGIRADAIEYVVRLLEYYIRMEKMLKKDKE